ncbi:MAG: DUF447 family protein [Candidatus Bathyarchaeia archaeon]
MSGGNLILSSLGLEVGLTYEAIVTTVSAAGEYNAAPMGIRRDDDTSVSISPFKTSRTYHNLVVTKEAVVNFTDEPYLFFATAFKEDKPLDLHIFSHSKTVKAPRLTMAESFLELRVVKVNEFEDRSIVKCCPLLSETRCIKPKPYCRGRYAALEAVIHATRIKILLENGQLEEASRLIQLVQSYRSLVHRVADSSSYSLVIDKVDEMIRRWHGNKLLRRDNK